MGPYKLLFLLIILCPAVSWAQSCRSLLQNTDYASYELAELEIRTPEAVIESRSTALTLRELTKQNQVIFTSPLPQTRSQCYGTCYLYANIGLIENELIREGIIEHGDLVLAPSVLIETAQARVISDRESTTLAQLLHGGITDAYHSINGNELFILPQSEIRRLGPLRESTEMLLVLEDDFLDASLQKFDQNFRIGDTSIMHPMMSELVTDFSIDFFHEYGQAPEELRLQPKTVGPLSFNYTFHSVYYAEFETAPFLRPYSLSKTIDTRLTPTQKLQEQQIAVLNFENGDTLQKLEAKAFGDFEFYLIIQKLLNRKFVFAGLDETLFDESHAILLTNVVVDHESKSILGFIFLDSNTPEEGYNGYRFINVEELRAYMTFFSYVNEIRVD